MHNRLHHSSPYHQLSTRDIQSRFFCWPFVERKGSRENFNSLRLLHERFFVLPSSFSFCLSPSPSLSLPLLYLASYNFSSHFSFPSVWLTVSVFFIIDFFIICLSFSIHFWFHLNSTLIQNAIRTHINLRTTGMKTKMK